MSRCGSDACISKCTTRFAMMPPLATGTHATRVLNGPNRRHAGRMPRTESASRVIRSTPAQVFVALVDEEALLQWLPPGGMSGRFERFDPRPGGSYRLVLTYEDGSSGSGKST